LNFHDREAIGCPTALELGLWHWEMTWLRSEQADIAFYFVARLRLLKARWHMAEMFKHQRRGGPIQS
jgi:hypothetical protein